MKALLLNSKSSIWVILLPSRICHLEGFLSTFASSALSAVIVLESSLNGWPLQEISNALYHPKGTLFTLKSSASKASSASFKICTATFGELNEEDKWA